MLWKRFIDTTRNAIPVLVAVAILLAPGGASADPTTVAGRWTERWGLFGKRIQGFTLVRLPSGCYQAEVASPRKREPRRLTLRHAAGAWQLTVEKRVRTLGVSDVLEGAEGGWRWGQPGVVVLEAKDGKLRGEGFELSVPLTPQPTTPAPGGLGGLGEPSSSTLPVVRVLVTGFDRFPRPANHPTYLDRPADQRQPRINPSGWSVRNFDAATLDPALRARARIEVHRALDVPVVYVEGARAILAQIDQVDADVCISFGVGADGNADADVETSCTNLMHDGSGYGSEGEGPFQLPASWPPSAPESEWSAEDRAWLWRYPDNAGVSYNRKKIDPAAPDTLRSTLPVSEIVARVQREGLQANDGGYGPGQYICNNVMFKVIDHQQKRGRIGGFIHMASWDESKRERYLKVLRCAIEESVKAVLAGRTTN